VVVSKGLSLWPVIAKIIELDNISESFENLIFVGLLLDNAKPSYEIYMSKCVEAILEAINSPLLTNLGISLNILSILFEKHIYFN
jgi:hypothetical protein